MVHAVLSETQTESVDTEVSNLLRKQAIEACDHEAGEYISPIFTRPKKDGSHRMILNLKSLNKNITHHHFKIDTVLSAVRLMKHGCFMASMDLKDVYHLLVTRLMKGVFESRPTLPRYNSIWNLSTVLDFIKTLGPNEELSLKNVTLKCVTLVALLSGQRCQTIHALRISGMKETNGQIRFDISTLLKTSKPGKHQEPLTFKPYA